MVEVRTVIVALKLLGQKVCISWQIKWTDHIYSILQMVQPGYSRQSDGVMEKKLAEKRKKGTNKLKKQINTEIIEQRK